MNPTQKKITDILMENPKYRAIQIRWYNYLDRAGVDKTDWRAYLAGYQAYLRILTPDELNDEYLYSFKNYKKNYCEQEINYRNRMKG